MRPAPSRLLIVTLATVLALVGMYFGLRQFMWEIGGSGWGKVDSVMEVPGVGKSFAELPLEGPIIWHVLMRPHGSYLCFSARTTRDSLQKWATGTGFSESFYGYGRPYSVSPTRPDGRWLEFIPEGQNAAELHLPEEFPPEHPTWEGYLKDVPGMPYVFIRFRADDGAFLVEVRSIRGTLLGDVRKG